MDSHDLTSFDIGTSNPAGSSLAADRPTGGDPTASSSASTLDQNPDFQLVERHEMDEGRLSSPLSTTGSDFGNPECETVNGVSDASAIPRPHKRKQSSMDEETESIMGCGRPTLELPSTPANNSRRGRRSSISGSDHLLSDVPKSAPPGMLSFPDRRVVEKRRAVPGPGPSSPMSDAGMSPVMMEDGLPLTEEDLEAIVQESKEKFRLRALRKEREAAEAATQGDLASPTPRKRAKVGESVVKVSIKASLEDRMETDEQEAQPSTASSSALSADPVIAPPSPAEPSGSPTSARKTTRKPVKHANHFKPAYPRRNGSGAFNTLSPTRPHHSTSPRTPTTSTVASVARQQGLHFRKALQRSHPGRTEGILQRKEGRVKKHHAPALGPEASSPYRSVEFPLKVPDNVYRGSSVHTTTFIASPMPTMATSASTASLKSSSSSTTSTTPSAPTSTTSPPSSSNGTAVTEQQPTSSAQLQDIPQLVVAPSAPPHVQIMTRHAVDLPREPVLAVSVPGAPISFIGDSDKTSWTGTFSSTPTSAASIIPGRDERRGSTGFAQTVAGAPVGTRMVVSPLIHVPAWSPPITKASMAELDLQQVLKNAQLRHDVVFDDGLRFKPNLEGARGDQKRLVANRYWGAIAREIDHGCRCTAYIHRPSATNPDPAVQLISLPCVCEGGRATGFAPQGKPGLLPLARIPSRVATLVTELRQVLVSLLPPSPPAGSSSIFCATPTRTHDMINQWLDPVVISEQMETQTLNLTDLGEFLGLVLKNHCAPMRDSLVDHMVSLITRRETAVTVQAEASGSASAQPEGLAGRRYEGLAGGLRMCFEVLELMKLDIANHQLRTLRPALLESALDFEIFQFREVYRRTPHLERTTRWYKAASGRVEASEGSDKVVDTVRNGLLELVFNCDYSARRWATTAIPESAAAAAVAAANARNAPPVLDTSSSPAAASVPESMHMDTVRLQNLHADLADVAIVYMLLMLFNQLAGHQNVLPSDTEAMKTDIWVFLADPALRLRGPDVRGKPGPGLKKVEMPAWREAMKDVLLQIAARAQAVKERGTGSWLPPLRPPPAQTLALVQGWMDSHLRLKSPLFSLMQRRLRQALDAVLKEQLRLALQPSTNSGNVIPSSIRAGRATAVEIDDLVAQIARRAKLIAANARNGTTRPASRVTRKRTLVAAEGEEGDKAASTAEKRTRLDPSLSDDSSSASATSSDSESEVEAPTTPSAAQAAQAAQATLNAILSRNGLSHLAPELRTIAARMGKLLYFHLRAFRGLYDIIEDMPASSTSVPANPTPAAQPGSSKKP